MSRSPLNIDSIADKLLLILSCRGSSTCGQNINVQGLQNLFENIVPYYNVPNQSVYYPPLLQPNRIQHTWQTAFSKSVLNNYYQGRLNTDVDSVIGEAIQNRIRKHTQNPQPFQFQIEAIVSGLNALDAIRSALRSGNINAIQSYNPDPSVIAVLAPTGGGKTEVFEALTLQLVLDCYKGNLGTFTKAIIIYPMKAFMIEHFRRFVEDITYINTQLGINISVGVLDGDTPDTLSTQQEVLQRLSYLLGSQQCPLCGGPLNVKSQAPYYIIECSRSTSHRLNVRIAKDMIFQQPPDILLTTIDSFNYILLEQNRHVLLGAPSGYTDPKRLPPLILALDEPHVYTGVFGSNTSLILRNFEYAVREYAKRLGIQQYKPIKIVASATMPHADIFLARLFVEEPQKIKIISSGYQQPGSQNRRGFVIFLPSRDFRFVNAVIEIAPLIAAILPRNYRKILVFVDSVESAERRRREIEDYIERGLPDYKACRHLFEPDVYDPLAGGFYPDAIRVTVHTSHIPRELRERIEEGIRKTPPDFNIVIATPTLELGIDIGDIAVVIIAGLPPTPEKFAQRAGRAGRRNPGLIIVIGNDSSAVDRYYLSDYNRTINYLQLSLGATPQPTYMLPLNPMNLESIRRFLGNFMATFGNIKRLNRISHLQGHSSEILRDYLSLTIDRVVSSFSFSRSNLPQQFNLLQNIASFAQSIRNSLNSDLMQQFQNIIRIFNQNYISSFVVPGYARQQYIRGRINFIPIIDSARSLTRPVEVQYIAKTQPPSSQQPKAFKREVDSIVALTYYAVSFIEPTSAPWHDYILRLQDAKKLINIGGVAKDTIYSLRGTLNYSSHRGNSYLFEVAGLFYSQLDALNNYNMLRQALQEFKRNVVILRSNSLGIDRTLLRTLRGHRISRVALKRFNELITSIDDLLNVSSQTDPHIVEPRIFYLLIPGFLGLDDNKEIHNMIRSHRSNLTPLDYFEVTPQTINNRIYWEFSKINTIKCPSCGNSDRFKLITFNRNNLSLRLRCLQCNKAFDLISKLPQGFIDMIRTRPVTFVTIIRRDPAIRRKLPNSPFELVFYRDIDAIFGNVGFRVSSINNKRANRFVRTRSLTSRDQYILGFRFKTQALELRIDWKALATFMGNRFIGLIQQVGNEYNSLGASIPQNFNVQNDFIIRVTHTLSHLLINFAPIHTGGNRWDLNEYVSFKTDDQNNIIASSIVAFDSAEGGNGVSELVGYFIREILSDALSEAAKYYLKPHNDALIKFFGEPGIIFFGVWPVCPYDNVALSRSLTLLFMQHLLGLPNIQQLVGITPQQLSSHIPRL